MLFLKNKHTLWDIKLNIYTQKIRFTSYKQYLLGFLFYRTEKKSHTDHSMKQVFLLSEKKPLANPQKWQLLKTFSPVGMLLVQLLLMNVFYVTTRKHFSYEFVLTEVFSTNMLRFLKPVLRKKSVF